MSVEILLPALSPTMESGKIVNWHKKVGDSVKSGEVVFEVETDKAVMEVEASDDGILACILIEEGECKVGDVVAVIAEKSESVEDIAKEYEGSKKSADDVVKESSISQDVSNSSNNLNSTDSIGNDVTDSSKKIRENVVQNKASIQSSVVQNADDIKRISPLAKKTAFEAAVSRDELFSISGSGQNNRVVSKDVNQYVDSRVMTENTHIQTKMYASNNNVQNNDVSKSKPVEFNIALARDAMNNAISSEQPSKMRQSIAQSLTKAVNEIPTFSMSQQCIMDDALNFVQKARELTGIKISLNDLIIKACSFAINQVKVFNTFWENNQIIRYSSVDVGFAVAVQSGVVVRILRNALYKNISEISHETKALSEEAREKNIHENYVFCISNMGGSGVESFSATLSGTAILAVGSCYKAPVVVDDEIVVKHVMNVSLTCDHRLIDGIDAANWMKFFKVAISNPSMMLLS
jgi:pyruvate dehydrogenase E2 component (dihydrolipoamide acetyltransferase)